MNANKLKKLADYLTYLYGRWLDEREYESFDRYVDAMRSTLEDLNCKLIKFTKRPWEIHYKLADGTRKWMRVRSDCVEWGGFKKA